MQLSGLESGVCIVHFKVVLVSFRGKIRRKKRGRDEKD